MKPMSSVESSDGLSVLVAAFYHLYRQRKAENDDDLELLRERILGTAN